MNYFTEKDENDALSASLAPRHELAWELPIEFASNHQVQSGFSDRWFQQRLMNRLKKLEHGSVMVHDPAGAMTRLGSLEIAPGETASEHLNVQVFVRQPKFFRRVMLGGAMGAAESYIDGDWGADHLTNLIRTMIRNLDHLTWVERTSARVKGMVDLAQHWLKRNSVSNSRKNIHAHYDLGNDFYQLWLDPTMNYSAGIFSAREPVTNSDSQLENLPEKETMHQASLSKMERIAEKLQLRPSDHVLEIGTGWGGLAIHLARRSGCRVTTTTISQQQFDYATAAVAAAGLSDQVMVLQQDYRRLTGQFDKLVSIEMIEAVGHQYFDTFFAQCEHLLNERGLMLLQAITIDEPHYRQHLRQVDFIRRYVFPGGCLPSISALQDSIARKTSLRMLHLEDLSAHYVQTLQVWRKNFMHRLSHVRSLGFDEKFIRLWHYYLCYCEAAFAERRVHSLQVVYSRRQSSIDPVLDYRFQ